MTAVLAWLTGSTLGRYLAAGILIAASIGTALLAAFARGERAQQLKQQAQATRDVSAALRANTEVQQMPVQQRREALKKWSRG